MGIEAAGPAEVPAKADAPGKIPQASFPPPARHGHPAPGRQTIRYGLRPSTRVNHDPVAWLTVPGPAQADAVWVHSSPSLAAGGSQFRLQMRVILIGGGVRRSLGMHI